jgi:hypothetical protein
VLQLEPDPTFTWPVTFNTPKGAKTITLVFKHKTVDEHNAWWEAAVKRSVAHRDALIAHAAAIEKLGPDDVVPPAPKPEMTALDEIMDVVAGWEDVDAPFSRESMTKLLANYHDLSAKKVCEAWSAGLNGRRLEN